MKLRFTISRKLGIAFGILVVVILVYAYLTIRTVNRNRQINFKNTQVYAPSASYLRDLFFLINNSSMLIRSWVYIDKIDDTPDKIRLKRLHSVEYPKIKERLDSLSSNWNPKNRKLYLDICYSIDTLFSMHKNMMSQLNTFESYDDPMVFFDARMQVEEQGEVTQRTNDIMEKLSVLVESQEEIARKANREMLSSFDWFARFVLILGIIVSGSGIIIAFFTIRAIVIPVNYIKNVILSMGKGILPDHKIRTGSDEIGEMSKALNLLIEGLNETSEFAQEIGKGNFDEEFTPMSNKDRLGNSLLEMRHNLYVAKTEEEKRKEEDLKRNWAAQGLAMFGDILRENTQIKEFSQSVMRKLIEYLHTDQGGLYSYNDDNPEDIHLELIASVAYNREKNLQRRIELDDGLVGDCAISMQTKYIKNLPDNYVKIKSGLGEDKPRCLLIVPLKTEEEIMGVIELASLNYFDKHEIEFVETLAARIASVLFARKTNIRTVKLLKKSQNQATQLEIQEIELRDTIKKLTATQVEMQKVQDKLQDANIQLKHNEEQLEQKVLERTAEIKKQRDKIMEQNKNITDSIHYAKRIQTAILPPERLLKKNLRDYFILFKPRDIVSGDFYWFTKKNNLVMVAAADCTGHGVPGAFMSMLGISLLNEIVSKTDIIDADLILNELREQVKTSLRQTGRDGEAKDGMDMALCVFDFDNRKLQFAGAYNPLIYVRNEKIHRIKPDKMPIGIYFREKGMFTKHVIDIRRDDIFYMFSDGYVDQFGGKEGTKFMIKNFKNLLLQIHKLPMKEQHDILNKTIEDWRSKKYEQVDDILVFGIKV